MPGVPTLIAIVVTAFITLVTVVLTYFTFVVSSRQEFDAGGRTGETGSEEAGNAASS